MSTKRKNILEFRKAISSLILLCFVTGQVWTPSMAHAQTIPGLNLPTPGAMVGMSPSYVPIAIKGLKVYPDNPFRFDFILDTGNSKFEGQKLQDQTNLLIKYFLAALTVPDDDQWVNLSPYEKDRVIPNQFGVTEMGRDLLAQDYLLKQLTASLIYPEHELGKSFWERVHKKAYEKYGDVDIPISTFNKVWIMPDHAKVFESGQMALITESHLKVMLDSDYLALKENTPSIARSPEGATKQSTSTEQIASPTARYGINSLGSEIIREIVLPEIEKEINEGKNFTKLRQIYHSMIMATWFKRKLKNGMLSKVYIGANKVAGVDVEDKEVKQKIYDQYLAAFKQGVYNYIKEEFDEKTKETVPRKYFSGGFMGGKTVIASTAIIETTPDDFMIRAKRTMVGAMRTASIYLKPVGNFLTMQAYTLTIAQRKQLLTILTPQQLSKSENALAYLRWHMTDYTWNYLIKETLPAAKAIFDKRGSFEEFWPFLLSMIDKRGESPPLDQNGTLNYFILLENIEYLLKTPDDLRRVNKLISEKRLSNGSPFVASYRITYFVKKSEFLWNEKFTFKDVDEFTAFFNLYHDMEVGNNYIGHKAEASMALLWHGMGTTENLPQNVEILRKSLEQWHGRDVYIDHLVDYYLGDGLKNLKDKKATTELAREIIVSGVPNYVNLFGRLVYLPNIDADKNKTFREFVLNPNIDLKTRMMAIVLGDRVLNVENMTEYAFEKNSDIRTAVTTARSQFESGLTAMTSATSSQQRKIIADMDSQFDVLLKSFFTFILVRPLTEKEAKLLADPETLEKITTIMSVYATLESVGFREADLMRARVIRTLHTLLSAYDSSNLTDAAAFAQARAKANTEIQGLTADTLAYIEAPHQKVEKSNKEIIEDLVAAGYSPKLWSDGIAFEMEVNEGITEEDKQDSIQSAASEFIDIAQKLGIKEFKGEKVENVLIRTYAQAKELTDVLKADAKISDEDKRRITAVLYFIQVEENQPIVEKLEKAKFKVTIQDDFLAKALAGLGVPGCFHPTGVHREMPLVHAFESNSLFIQVNSEDGKQVANAVVILTVKGAYVYPLHSSSFYRLTPVFAKAITQLTQYVPRVIVDPTSAGYKDLERYATVSSEGIELVKPAPVFHKAYYDSGDVAKDGTLTKTVKRPSVITKEAVLSKDGTFEIAAPQAEQEPEQLVDTMDFQKLADGLLELKGDYKKFFFLIGTLKKRVAQEGKWVIDNLSDFKGWVEKTVTSKLKDESVTKKEIDTVAWLMIDFLDHYDWPVYVESHQEIAEQEQTVAAKTKEEDNQAPNAAASPATEQTASTPSVKAVKSQNLGGIDMNSKTLDLETEGKGIDFDMPFDPTQLQNIQIDGFSPVILQIVPTDLPLFIGSNKADKELQVSSAH